MNIRLYNAEILDLDENASLKKGEVVVSDGIISNVIYYDDNELSHQNSGIVVDKVIDCGGNLLMRGFNNAHAHSAMTFLRSLADPRAQIVSTSLIYCCSTPPLHHPVILTIILSMPSESS